MVTRRFVRNRLVLISAALLGVVVASAGVRVWWAARREATEGEALCIHNLTVIATALHQYHQAYGSFPPAYVADERGRHVHSWRVLVLGVMGEPYRGLYERYDFREPWDGPHNRQLWRKIPPFYLCPNDRQAAAGAGSYALVTGAGTAFPGAGTTSLGDVIAGRGGGVFVAEVADAMFPWTEPRDIVVRSQGESSGGLESLGPASHDPLGVAVLDDLADRYRLGQGTDPEKVRAVLAPGHLGKSTLHALVRDGTAVAYGFAGASAVTPRETGRAPDHPD